MTTTATRLSLAQTGVFSKLAKDYVSGADALRCFYTHLPYWEGMADALKIRQQFTTNRTVLVEGWKLQYEGYAMTPLQQENLEALVNENTFTITTAHQPNIFTGPLYFIYKILHAVKLAEAMNAKHPGKHFVPVYYMGSEDADLDELGHFFVEGEKYEWATDQTGAVGRMNTAGLEKLAKGLEGRFAHLPYGKEMAKLCSDAYTKHANVQEATFYLVNELFKSFGLLVLIPDSSIFKQLFVPVIQRELTGGFSQPLVDATVAKLETAGYKIQVKGRAINLFYLDENGRRERIEKTDDHYTVEGLGLTFSEKEMMELAVQRPELFSANVILRGLFQETLLPNIAFVGGGGELAYWLELKAIFEAAGVPYPVLVLRNSLMLMQPRHQQIRKQTGLQNEELFLSASELKDKLANQLHGKRLAIGEEEQKLFLFYEHLQQVASATDVTLKPFVAALHTKAIQGLQAFDAKLKRAQRRKLGDTGRQIEWLKNSLFPLNSLQERVENFMPFYAEYGPEILHWIYQHSGTLEMDFTVIDLPEKQ